MVLVLMVVGSIALLKVTVTLLVGATPVAPDAGLTAVTVGAELSVALGLKTTSTQ